MFKSLLIANRGEIAVRVMRTAKRMGLRTIAVYSDADAGAMHVALADASVRIGPASARESYLDMAAIIAAAHETKAEAIHPGYGFLSENADFAEACAKAKVIFVGPPPTAIRAMGLKDRAKALMEKAGVPVVPGYFGDDQSLAHLEEEAKAIGYPVLIKAVAGGGGKGMRRVDKAGDFAEALGGAQREAESAFGNGRVLIEKYVAQPRHIEMQVFADSHGNVVHLFERDCSLQRRHQKVIEEAPAPGMPADMRAAMGEAAVAAARAVKYEGAGTVEFIADASKGLRTGHFWFMEMNTRLQVEHPVTEMITGLDLVEWQLRVAAGEKLPKMQKDILISGHAIEARLYAEDPQRGFLPSIGTLEWLHLPADGAHIRVDTGVREGDEVTPFYDPMIAKVIAHDKTREGAAKHLATGLAKTEIAGPHTNTAFLVTALRHPDFIAGKIDTGFIERHLAKLIPDGKPSADIVALAALFVVNECAADAVMAEPDPWNAGDGFRLAGDGHETIEFESQGALLIASIIYGRDGSRKIETGGNAFAEAQLPAAAAVRTSRGIAVMREGATYLLSKSDPLVHAEEHAGGADAVRAPMPGKVIQLLVKKGDKLKRGAPIAVLEAMKMEHTLAAPTDVTIESVSVGQGDQVVEGAVIAKLKLGA